VIEKNQVTEKNAKTAKKNVEVQQQEEEDNTKDKAGKKM
jgi:hypothetical protein